MICGWRSTATLAACLAATVAWSAAPADTSPDWQHLRDELVALQRTHRVPFLNLVILDRRRPVLIHASTYGTDRSFDVATPFRWGSISKTVTALVLLEAARRHNVDLSTPVRDVLDELPYRNPFAPAAPVRLAHLVELTAGLPDLLREEFADNTPLPLATALRRHADRRVLLWPPGLQHSYSNVPPGISAAVIEQLTGRSFEDAAARLVLEPLGMTGASFAPVAGLPGGFQADGRTPIPYWHMTFRAFGALNASPAAMARLLEALLNEGAVQGRQALAPAIVDRAFRSEASLGARHGLDIGYGAGLYGWVSHGHLFQGHGGDADGYRARFGLLRDAGRGYLIGIDVDDPALLRDMQRRIEQALTADLRMPVPPPVVTLPRETLARYTGTWYPSAARFGIQAWQAGEAARAVTRVDNGELTFRHRGRTVKLVAVAEDRFRREHDPLVTVVFATDGGRLYLQGELGNFVQVAPDADP